jgi:EAL and modified HD-GYP domain-containing signal transduction protein
MFHEQTVLELLEDVEPTAAVVAGVQRLKARGFRIALDDFSYRPEYHPLLELADFVKVDLLDDGERPLGGLVSVLRRFRARLVAEKVETAEQFRECQQLGFDYFQGHHFSRAQTLTDRIPPSNKLVVLNLLARLADPALAVGELERALSADVSLSYKLLRYVNSAAFARRREVESLKDAIILAGFDAVRGWAALLLLASIDAHKPRELIKLAMIRARMCERLARAPGLQGQAFITGLFSVLEALMDVPMAVLLDNLALRAPIRFALLAREGELGALLQQVLWYERGEWLPLIAAGAGHERLVAAYLEAVRWTDENVSRMFS